MGVKRELRGEFRQFVLTCDCYDHIEPGIKFNAKACRGHSISGQCGDWRRDNAFTTIGTWNVRGNDCEEVSCWCEGAGYYVLRDMKATASQFKWMGDLMEYGEGNRFSLKGRLCYHHIFTDNLS